MLNYENEKVEINIGKIKYESRDFIATINQFIKGIYYLCIENKESYYISIDNNSEILMQRTENEKNIECLINEEKNNININLLVNEVNEVCKNYFSNHSIDYVKDYEYDKYIKIKKIIEIKEKY